MAVLVVVVACYVTVDAWEEKLDIAETPFPKRQMWIWMVASMGVVFGGMGALLYAVFYLQF